jgi:alginate O-acetyltransferase complex protein AlgJ
MSRETEAELALKNTVFAPVVASAVTIFFLVTLVAVPAIQSAFEFRSARTFSEMPSITAFGSLFPRRIHFKHLRDLWAELPTADQTKSVQRSLERESVVGQWLLPRVESFLTGMLRAGNEQVYLGREDWLFYRPDVDYLIGSPFFDPFWIKRRTLSAAVHPDSVKAIVDFRDQLARRGIELIVMPTPVKPSVAPKKLASNSSAALVENESFARFKTALDRMRVHVFDPESLLREDGATSAPLYLKADTHWRPETMELIARKLAEQIGVRAEAHFETVPKKIHGLGDIARLLKLPAEQLDRYTEDVTIHQVREDNSLWQPRNDSDVLLLGDSFSNVFSLEVLGWGDSAGFAEHLSNALGRPIDCILRNSDGAFATREILSAELARGRDRLARKKIVVWQFASRELAFGDWKLLTLTVGKPPVASFFVPKTGQKVNVTGIVQSISRVPVPGSAPYADHIMSIHLVDVIGAIPNDTTGAECLVYLWSMRDNVWTSAAGLRPGDRVRLTLQPWSDVSAQLEKINRSDIQDANVQLQEPCWGELAK